MIAGRRGGRWALSLVLPVVLATSCTHGTGHPPSTLQSNTPEPTSSTATLVAGAHADLYVVHDDNLEGLDVSRLRAGQPALPDALASHATVPGAYDIARLGSGLLAIDPHDTIMLVDPASGRLERTVNVTASLLQEPAVTSLILDEADSTPDRKTTYVAGRFGRPNDRLFYGFVLGFDPQLKVTSIRKFNDVVQRLAADERGAVAVLAEGDVVDAVSGATLKKPTYERAKEAIAIRRVAGRLWLAVGDNGNPFLLTPQGKVVLPSPRAYPIALVAIPGGMVVICQGVDAVYLVTGTTVRTVKIPQTGAGAVLLGKMLYVLSAGSDKLTRINLDDLTTEEYGMPQVTALVA